MLGKIIEYSSHLNSGIILGNDQKNYPFQKKHWCGVQALSIGSEVNFEIDTTGQVSDVYPFNPPMSNHTIQSELEHVAIVQQEAKFGMIQWFIKSLKNYSNFHGRARRKEFWYFYLCQIILLIPAIILDIMLETYIVFYGIIAFALIIPSIAVSIRRLHDINRSGWYYLMLMIPFANFIVLFWFFTETQAQVNRWGPPAK